MKSLLKNILIGWLIGCVLVLPVEAKRRWIPGASSGTPDPTPELLWWQMKDGIGTTVTATVGSNGTTDATWLTTTPSGSGFCLGFNGSSQNAGTNSSVAFGVNAITVCGWFYLNDSTTTQVVYESGPQIDFNVGSVLLYITGGNLIGILNDTSVSSLYRIESITCPSTGAWHNFSLVFDGSTLTGDVVWYIDGVLTSSTLVTNTRNSTGNFATQIVHLCSRNEVSLFMNGRADDFRIYNRVLNQAEITAVYNDPK